MNEKTDLLAPFGDLTVKELTEVTQELLQDALDVASASRISKLKISGNSCSVPLVRDSLLSWASLAMAVRARLLYWTETREYESGLAVRTIGMSFTHGSALVMELIDTTRLTIHYTKALKSLLRDADILE